MLVFCTLLFGAGELAGAVFDWRTTRPGRYKKVMPVLLVAWALLRGGPSILRLIHRVTSGSTTTTAVPILRILPVYPPEAVKAGVQGPVRIEVMIEPDGRPRVMDLIEGDEMLYPAAKAAVEKWRFSAPTSDGQPAEQHAVLDVPFQ